MRRISNPLLPYVFVILSVGVAFAEPRTGVDPKPNAQNGERLALQWCASCHLVAPTQRQASAAVPSFAEIAKRPRFNAAQLALFLLDPHPVMPNLALTRREAADLAAYIAQMRK
jgi:mono/diheme cytochrome c family protein